MKHKNRLWLLRPAENLPAGNNPWEPWYDKVFGFVVCAVIEDQARELASKQAGPESDRPFGNPWMSAKYSTCIELTAEHPVGVVMIDEARA